MGLFRSNKQKQAGGNVLAAKLAKGILHHQSRIAAWLNHKTKSFSGKTWLMLLIMFCVIVGSTCLYLIITSI